jgi:hypothetical protein
MQFVIKPQQQQEFDNLLKTFAENHDFENGLATYNSNGETTTAVVSYDIISKLTTEQLHALKNIK